MRATFTVEVPDEFVDRRAAEFAERHGDAVAARMGRARRDGLDYFLGRCQDIAQDELPVAFHGWPVEVAVSVEAGP